jgi:hypothetical protein
LLQRQKTITQKTRVKVQVNAQAVGAVVHREACRRGVCAIFDARVGAIVFALHC